jgi:aminoglycoside phosphotransferase family enzyme
MSESTMKAFDAVQMMRNARAAISAKIASMSVDEQNEWLQSNPPADPTLRRLFTLAAHQGAAADGAKKPARRG